MKIYSVRVHVDGWTDRQTQWSW